MFAIFHYFSEQQSSNTEIQYAKIHFLTDLSVALFLAIAVKKRHFSFAATTATWWKTNAFAKTQGLSYKSFSFVSSGQRKTSVSNWAISYLFPTFMSESTISKQYR